MYICIWKSVGRNLKQIYRELQLEIKSNQMICKWKNKILIWKGQSVHLSICKRGTSWSRPLSLLQIVSCVIDKKILKNIFEANIPCGFNIPKNEAYFFYIFYLENYSECDLQTLKIQ